MRKLHRLFPIRRLKPAPAVGGQGMVEFALVLPVLLLIMLAIIELGHLLFYYGSLYAASREAARYGAAVDVPGATPKYLDVAGMRAAAKRVGFIVGLADDQIDISYDCGHGTASSLTVPTCSANQMLRVAVQVDATYNTIVPFPPVPSFPVSSTVARTVVHDLEVEGNFPTRTPIPPTPTPDCAELMNSSHSNDLELIDGGNLVDFPNWHVVIVQQTGPDTNPDPVTLNHLLVETKKNSQNHREDLQVVLLDPVFADPSDPDPDLVTDSDHGVIWTGNRYRDPIYLDGRQVGAAPRMFYLKFADPDYKADVTIQTFCGDLPDPPPLPIHNVPPAVPYP